MKMKYKFVLHKKHLITSLVLSIPLLTTGLAFASNSNIGTANKLIEIKSTNEIKTSTTKEIMGVETLENAKLSLKNLDLKNVSLEAEKARRTPQQIRKDAIDVLFPVRSSRLHLEIKDQAHRFTPHKNKLPSVVLVGSDDYSLEWLDLNADRIKQIGAVIMLVDANNAKDYEKVLSFASGNEVYPMSGNLVNTNCGIDFYPVLVTSNGYYQ